MARQLANGPMAVLSDESQRTAGDDARAMNLQAARAVASAVRTTLGPRGMDKMLVDKSGNVVVTNDGVTLLEEMDVSHPAADIVVEVASTQEFDVGDGTTSATVLTGELLAVAEELLDRDIHPTTIVSGYEEALDVALDALDDLAEPVDVDDDEILRRIAETAMTGKGAETAKETLSEIVVRAVRAATEDGAVDRDGVVVRTFHGASIEDSRFVPGVLLDKDPVRADMETDLDDANVLVYEGALEVSDLEIDAEATVTDFDGMNEFAEREESELEDLVDPIVEAGADVVIAEGGIDDYAQELLVANGVTAFRRIGDEERARLAKATGASRVGDVEGLSADDLGHVGSLEQERIREYTFKRDAPSEETVVFGDLPEADAGTILLRGGTEHALEEVERAIEDSIDVVTATVEDGEILPGGGAPEIALSLALRDAAEGVEGREQLAVDAFADAVETIPRILAENAGHDAIDAIVDLKAKHDGGQTTAGLDAESGEVVDSLEAGVVEPKRVKTTALDAAVDAATMILRIDDVVSAGDLDTSGDDEN